MNGFDEYKNCQLCPRHCGTDRASGKKGICGETAALKISHIGAHFGEEPAFSGSCGSGTIFFSGCSSRCFFCQNYQISVGHEGREYTQEEFLEAVKKLIATGVHNLNFVTPDHFWPHIKALCQSLRDEGISIPKVFNSSGYQDPAMIGEYAEFMDMFMPDFKFAQGAFAKTCMNDENYPKIALEAIRRMVDAKGFLEPWDPDGIRTAERGVIVRHLVLPGYAENSLEALKILHQEFGPGLPLSVMSQFRPTPLCYEKKNLTRGLRVEEYAKVLELADHLGFERVFMQEVSEATEYFPDFKNPVDPFPGHRKNKTAD